MGDSKLLYRPLTPPTTSPSARIFFFCGCVVALNFLLLRTRTSFHAVALKGFSQQL